MFQSDKNLRKGVPTKKVSSVASAASVRSVRAVPSSDANIVEVARIEREQRQVLRDQIAVAIKIQSWWRGKACYRNTIRVERTTFDAKLTDFVKISVLLSAKTGVVLLPKIPTIVELLTKLSFTGCMGHDDVQRWVKLCEVILNPSLGDPDSTRNIIIELSSEKNAFLLTRILSAVIIGLSGSFSKRKHISGSKNNSVNTVNKMPLCLFLNGIVGNNSNYKLKFPEIIDTCFINLRETLVRKYKFFQRLRGLLIVTSDPLCNVANDVDEYSFSRIVTRPPSDSNIADSLLATCLFVVEVDNAHYLDRLSIFSRDILTVPLLTCLLSETALTHFSNWTSMEHLLNCYSKDILALPSSPHSVFSSGQWLLGNIASLSAFLNIDGKTASTSTPSTPRAAAVATATSATSTTATTASITTPASISFTSVVPSDALLCKYLQRCTALLSLYFVPGVLQGKKGVIWSKEGASMTAAGIPLALQQQILTLLTPRVTTALYARILLPLRSEAANYALAGEIQAIQECLSSTSLMLSQQTIIEEDASSVWFSSKWAKKIVKKMGKSIGINTKSTSNNNNAVSSNSGDSTNIFNEQNNGSNLPECSFPVSIELITNVLPLFCILSSLAASAPHDSAPFKNLSSLVFATRIIDRSWIALLEVALTTSPSSSATASYSSKNSNTESASSSLTFVEAAASFLTLPSFFGSSSSTNKKRSSTAESSNTTLKSNNATTTVEAVAKAPSLSSTFRDPTVVYNELLRFASAHYAPLSSLSVPSSAARESIHSSGCCFYSIGIIVSLLKVCLLALDDSELYNLQKPLPLHQVIHLISTCKVLLFRTITADPLLLLSNEPQQQQSYGSNVNNNSNTSSSNSTNSKNHIDTAAVTNSNSALYVQQVTKYNVLKVMATVLADLYSRWARRPFSRSELWEVDEANSSNILSILSDPSQPITGCLLKVMPWSVTFPNRLKLFRNRVDASRLAVQGAHDPMHGGYRSRGVVVRVRRSMLLEDAMTALTRMARNPVTGNTNNNNSNNSMSNSGNVDGSGSILDRIIVRYINVYGEEEAGIDAGGLFKDLMTDLSKIIFDPSYGLFSLTSNNTLFPNPTATVLYNTNNNHTEVEALYRFLGIVLGKALYENITLQPQFAHFFLATMQSKYNYMNMLHDLSTLDEELYKNLMFLKYYDGDVGDLCLTFSITDDSFGTIKEIELIRGGAEVAVTSTNKYKYIHLVAKYYLHDRIKIQSKAFFSGLYQVIAPDLLSTFCAPELQVVISGATSAINMSELKQHCRYAGGYHVFDSTIRLFWSVVEEDAEFSEQDKSLLLKFVTACERPPSLGFSGLNPQFTIQRVECNSSADADSRLPTSSTCFNTLKLPPYSSKQILKQKLLLSIRSNSGFDLS